MGGEDFYLFEPLTEKGSEELAFTDLQAGYKDPFDMNYQNGARHYGSDLGRFLSLENGLTESRTKQVFPSFSKLWANYPPDNSDGSHAHPSRDSYPNQCAIRMGYCLQKSGVDFSSYTEPLTSDGYPRGSKSLANWIWREFWKPKSMSLEEFRKNYSDKTGIFFEFAEKGYIDHIDLWNKGKVGSGFYTVKYKEIWFWEIK